MNKGRSYVTMSMLMILMLSWACQSKKQTVKLTVEDYQKAEELLPWNMSNKVLNVRPVLTPIQESQHIFWYKKETLEDHEYTAVDSEKKSTNLLFLRNDLVELLNQQGDSVQAEDFVPYNLTVAHDLSSCSFSTAAGQWKYDIQNKSLEQMTTEHMPRNSSPDGKWNCFVEGPNLKLKHNESEKVYALTTNGSETRRYAQGTSWFNLVDETLEEEPTYYFNGTWSHNSKMLATYLQDNTDVRKLYLWKSVPEDDFMAHVYSYERPLPGDSIVTVLEPLLFDIQSRKMIKVKMPPVLSVTNWGEFVWNQDDSKVYMKVFSRGFKSVQLVEIDAKTGNTKVLIEEQRETYISPEKVQYKLLEKRGQILWASEKDDWNHLYLHDIKTGETIKQLTQGEFVLRAVEHVDEENGLVYASYAGKETDRDPYLRHLYKVDMESNEMALLTPENADHDVQFFEGSSCFVDNYSRADVAPICVMRSVEDGSITMPIEEANTQALQAMNWRYPEPFEFVGRDGKTKMYGLMYKPRNFDPNKKYPVIDATYSGPHTQRAWKNFYRAYLNHDQVLAELGFVVLLIDGFGSNYRGKKFQDFSYKNLGDIGAEDHMLAMKQLQEKHGFLDLDRVGIYGRSAGGYDAARALLAHPKFYKVGVATCGNHDHRTAKAWWPELYMGYPVGPYYDEQSNVLNADKLEGKLLLVHGDMDDNVNPAASMQLADALIKANKDFDLLILPNVNHTGTKTHPYYIRKRWDYFAKHLGGYEHPEAYKIQGPEKK